MNTRKGSITETMLSIFSEKIELPELSKRTASAKLEQFDASFSCLKQLTLATRTSAQGFASHDNSSQHFSQCFTVITDLWNQLAAIRLASTETPSSLRDFLLLWSSFFLPNGVKYTGEHLFLCAVPLTRVVCAALRCVRANVDAQRVNEIDSPLQSSSTAVLSSCLIDLMTDLKAFIRVGQVGLPQLPIGAILCCADVLRLIQINIEMQEERDQQSDPSSPNEMTQRQRGGLAAAFVALEEQLDLSMHQFASLWCEKVLFASLLSEKWTATTKYFGGRVVSHAVRFFWSATVGEIRQPTSLTTNHQEALLRFLTIRLSTFLKQYQDFVLHVCRKISPARLVQLRVDVLFLLRLVRLLRDVVSTHWSDVHHQSLKLLAMISIVTSSEDDAKQLEGWTTGGRNPITNEPTSGEASHSVNSDFASVVWHCEPITKDEFWVSASLQSLLFCGERVFIKFIPHDSITAVAFPSPMVSLSSLRDSQISDDISPEPLIKILDLGKCVALIESRVLR